ATWSRLRIARAILPDLPITRPISSSATSSSSTSSPSSSKSSTFTWSGAATSALAMCSTSAFGLGEESVMLALALKRVPHLSPTLRKVGTTKFQKLLTAEIAEQSQRERRENLNRLKGFDSKNPGESAQSVARSYEATGSAGAAFPAKLRILPTRSDTCAPFERQ